MAEGTRYEAVSVAVVITAVSQACGCRGFQGSVMRCFGFPSLSALLAMADVAEAAPWRRSAAGEKPYLFPPGWDREPSCYAYHPSYCPWLLKNSTATVSRPAVVAAISGASYVPSVSGAVELAISNAEPWSAPGISAASIGMESSSGVSQSSASSVIIAVSIGESRASEVSAPSAARVCHARFLVPKPKTNMWNRIVQVVKRQDG